MPTNVSGGEPVCIAGVGDVCGEGAVWHPEEAALYWTDINRFLIHRWDWQTHAVETWQFAEPVTALALTTRVETLVVVLGSRVVLWEPMRGAAVDEARLKVIYRLPGWPEARCNDARVDPEGGLWVATMQNNVSAAGEHLPVDRVLGELLSIDGEGRTRTWRTGLSIGNTIVWSPDGRWMYTADSMQDEICRFDWHAGGGHADISIGGEMLFFKGNDEALGLPDGSSMDAEGCLWNCRYGGACVLRIDADGRMVGQIAMPVRNPTTCVFGGADGTTLFVTSAGHGDDSLLAGGLFSVETGVRGLAANRFRLG